MTYCLVASESGLALLLLPSNCTSDPKSLYFEFGGGGGGGV